ncbi:MAG: histidinol dehydrogenase, partial [Verrucomicrobiota bacterium]
MNVLRYSDANFGERLNQLAHASSLFDSTIEERTRTILEAVRARGDDALIELTERFDGARLTIDSLLVTKSEKFNASLLADENLRNAVALSRTNIEQFSRKSLR